MITQPLISSWKESLAIVGHAVCIHPQCRLCFLSLAGKNILLFVYLQEMSYVPAVQEWLVTTRTARAGRARQTTSRARTAARGSSSSARYRRTTRSVTTTCSGTKHYRHVSRVTRHILLFSNTSTSQSNSQSSVETRSWCSPPPLPVTPDIVPRYFHISSYSILYSYLKKYLYFSRCDRLPKIFTV